MHAVRGDGCLLFFVRRFLEFFDRFFVLRVFFFELRDGLAHGGEFALYVAHVAHERRLALSAASDRDADSRARHEVAVCVEGEACVDEQAFAHVVEYADGYGVFVAVCAEAGAEGRGLVRVVWHRVQRGEAAACAPTIFERSSILSILR